VGYLLSNSWVKQQSHRNNQAIITSTVSGKQSPSL